MYSAYTNK